MQEAIKPFQHGVFVTYVLRLAWTKKEHKIKNKGEEYTQ